jgi:small subunit ribosomal protein S20
MPVIKSAKKQLRQSRVKKARNYPLRNEVKSVIKKGLELIKDGKLAEAAKFMPKAYQTIDMACKKNIIHRNNAAHKKSRLAKALSVAQGAGAKKPAKA